MQTKRTDEILESMPRKIYSKNLIRGIAVNDSPFCIGTKINGNVVMHRAYSTWMEMLKRCYSNEFHAIQPTYSGCYVSKEWLRFSSSYEWWKDNFVDGWQLDKDLIKQGNKIYSKDTCIYVPARINTFASGIGCRRGALRHGVHVDKRTMRFVARIANNGGGYTHIGTYDSEEEAGEAWVNAKLEAAKEIMHSCNEIDERIYITIVGMIRNSNKFVRK